MKQYLIGESGGTKTDWCFIDKCKTKTYFTRKSYHPLNCTQEFLDSEKQFWQSHAYMMESDVHFFGSGCFREKGSEKLLLFLKAIGLKKINIFSDLHAAGRASFWDDDGSVAILGTGSVLFNWHNCEVQELIGGKGFIKGDEGSGFYFGKLIYEAYVKGMLSSEQQKVMNSFIVWNEFDQSFSNQTHKTLFSELSFKLKDFRILFHEFHVKNIQAFCDAHLIPQRHSDFVTVVGSYGFHHQRVVKEVFANYDVNVNAFIERPIERIVEQTVLFND